MEDKHSLYMFLIVSFALKHSCCCFSSGGRKGCSNDTVDSEWQDMSPAREISLGFAAILVFLRKMKLTLLDMA